MLLDRIRALSQDLVQTSSAIENAEVDRELRKRVSVPLRDLIDRRLNDLQHLRSLIEKDSPQNSWEAFQITRQKCEVLIKECLDFAQGALARTAGLDFGLCRIADALLMEIGHRADLNWNRFTIPAVGEFFHDIAGVIRVRFPESSIWSLPVACHELGHFAEQELADRDNGQTRRPIKEKLEQAQSTRRVEGPILRELFADLFATYALGPAYACTCILLRFDPSRAYFQGKAVDSKTHPSSAKRTYLILKLLKNIDASEFGSPYGDIVETLEKQWRASVPQELDPKDIDMLNYWGEVFNLELAKRAGLRHKSGRISEMISIFMRDQQVSDIFNRIDAKGLTLSDVLNAAWISRLRSNDALKIHQIGESAKLLCNELCLNSKAN